MFQTNHHVAVCLSGLSGNWSVHYADAQREINEDGFFIGTVKQHINENKPLIAALEDKNTDVEQDWFISLQSNGAVIKYKIDTGAQANILPLSMLQKLPVQLQL